MSLPLKLTISSVCLSFLLAVSVSAQDSKLNPIKITNPKLSSINLGLGSTEYWLEKMKDGDQSRGTRLLNDLEKLATRFNRVPKSNDEQYKFIVNRFKRLSDAIKEKAGRATGTNRTASPSTKPKSQGQPHRNLFTVNKQLDSIEQFLKSFDAANQNSVRRLKAQLENANQLFSSIPPSEHPDFVSTKKRMSSVITKCRGLIPQWNSDQDPLVFLSEMRDKYLKTLALPRAQRLMSSRELTDQDVKLFLGEIAAFGTDLDKDLPRIKAAATSTGTASDLVAWVEKESAEFIKSESEKLRKRLDAFVESALRDAKNLAGLDPQKNKYSFVTESVRKNNEAKLGRALRTLENAKSIEAAFNLPGRWSSKKDELERHLAAYREKAAQATTVDSLPKDLGNKKLHKTAAETLALKKYGIGQIERIIVNSKVVPRNRVQTRFFNGALETTIREWDEFQVCTVENEGGRLVVYFNTLKKFSRGPDTTPIDQWILSNRFKSGEIAIEKLNQ